MRLYKTGPVFPVRPRPGPRRSAFYRSSVNGQTVRQANWYLDSGCKSRGKGAARPTAILVGASPTGQFSVWRRSHIRQAQGAHLPRAMTMSCSASSRMTAPVSIRTFTSGTDPATWMLGRKAIGGLEDTEPLCLVSPGASDEHGREGPVVSEKIEITA